MNAELVVIANQLRRGEYVLGSCTQNKCAPSSFLNKVVKIHSTFGLIERGSQKKLTGTILVTDVLEGLRQKTAQYKTDVRPPGVSEGRTLKNLIGMPGSVF